MRFRIILFALALVVGNMASAQGFFSRLPKSKPGNPFARAMNTTSSPFFGTDTWMFRPIVSITSYSVPGNEVSTGAGIAYELVSQDPATQVYTSVVSISGLINYNLPLTPETKPASPIGASIFLGLLNNHILVGTKYDGKRLNLEIGTAINFNN